MQQLTKKILLILNTECLVLQAKINLVEILIFLKNLVEIKKIALMR